MPVKKPVLGRGLDALFAAGPTLQQPIPPQVLAPPTSQTRQILIEEIRPNPFQPRTEFDPEKLEELAASIRRRGILQPILVRRRDEGFEIVAGERRWRAAQLAGLREVPAQIKAFSDLEMTEAALIENLQRDDLNTIEEARAYERLISHYGLTQETLADNLGKSRVAVTNTLRLLRLPSEVLELIEQDKLSAGHARALLTLGTPAVQIRLAKDIVDKALSVRQTEAMARRYAALAASDRPSNGQQSPSIPEKDALEAAFSERLGLKVRIKAKSNSSGTLEVSYSSLDEFHRLAELLGVESDKSL